MLENVSKSLQCRIRPWFTTPVYTFMKRKVLLIELGQMGREQHVTGVCFLGIVLKEETCSAELLLANDCNSGNC